jgi:hypothetical protein
MHPVLATEPLEAGELGERIDVVVDAQVELRPWIVAVDHERCRLPAALVAAGGLTRLHRGDQPDGKRQVGVGRIGRRHVVEDARAGEHVAGNRKVFALAMSAPADTGCARMRGDAAMSVHHVNLAVIASVVRREQDPDHVCGRNFVAQQAKSVDTVERIEQGLGGDRPDPGFDERHTGAHGEEFRRDRDAAPSGLPVAGDDRPGHRALVCYSHFRSN